MSRIEYESARYVLVYFDLYGVGYICRNADNIETDLITGMEMCDLRRYINRAKTNASSKKGAFCPVTEIVDALLDDLFVPSGD
jgi:hypothetical protein